MNETMLKNQPKYATMATLSRNSAQCTLTAARAHGGTITVDVNVGGALIEKDGSLQAPLSFFADVMRAYVTVDQGKATIERLGHVIDMEIHSGTTDYVDAFPVLDCLDVEYEYNQALGELNAMVEPKYAFPRDLTPAELALPYSKYYTEYWATPFHERVDVKAWAKKAHLFQLYSRKDPSVMLNINDTRKLLDPKFRNEEWQEGWTLFPDGTGVMCTKTEFPGTTCDMFQWWFAWHVKEDLRYMLWYPPAHYGISPALELREKVSDPNLSIYEKTHGGTAVHLVYESTPIDSANYAVAGPSDWHPIPFQDITNRNFLPEDLEEFERQGCVALCGGIRMLHFFANREDGTGGTLYTHFWYGAQPNGKGGLTGTKTEEDPTLIQSILNIGQHATKEFSRLADILPQLYSEEGAKPL